MSSINSLLNHEESASEPHPTLSASMHKDNIVAKTTTLDAADALTTLANLGSGQQYAPTTHAERELPSPTAYAHAHAHAHAHTHAPRRTSSFGSHIATIEPVEPSPPIEQSQAHSPTLDHYHHGSKSPETQRRQSLLTRTSPVPILAPMQSFTPAPKDNVQEESQQTSTEPQLPSPLPFIKHEPSGTPREATPTTNTAQLSERQHSVTTENVDLETLKAIEIAKQSDLGLRAKRNASVAESVTSPVDPKPTSVSSSSSKKRPAPTPSIIKKKGTAAPKRPASKRRKIETDVDSNARSATPTSRISKPAPGRGGKKGSQAGTPAAESSPAPENASQVHASDDEAESSEDSTLYCICRKPDNHKWMIGCDGGCDDWFHGSCVDMQQADEELVDKFICPNCEVDGRGQTTYKPMCRRDGCRKPARLGKTKVSKYCSDDCGVGFFQDQLQRTAGAKKPSSNKRSKKKGSSKDGEDQGNLTDEEEPTPLGGVIRAKDLKALVQVTKDIDSFKRLGSGVLSPPQTASPTKTTFNGLSNGTSANPQEDLSLTPAERMHLGALHTEKSHLKDRLEVLNDREKFVSMAREQATRYADKEKAKVKEFCGYDSRLSWSDIEFLSWRKSTIGCAAFKFGTLSPTADQMASIEDGAEGSSHDMDGDSHMNGVNDADSRICTKKRCPKHPQWQKLNLQDARFEELEIVEAIKECEKEERSVRERARRRGAKDAMAADLVGADGSAKVERNRDGWVEAVKV
ncbi:hypothetical protein K504DRAFT_380848 [Pleomassaria siparia CBS 279.74]|uniref:PHD-type domain-containing protein n=1 Tax=Pleomassaria siparia CBS 279.74 TaxID=1314801 RepID=A0A6G1K8L4_9PLEO|nr:hypothetical protein K504DRAFT_380848 [Pleomassaria siparia CBS 279.74]